MWPADDITQGLPRVVELFEARTPKGVAPIAEAAGRVTIEDTDKARRILLTPDDGSEEHAYPVSKRSRLLVAGRRARRGRHQAGPGCDRPQAGAAHPGPACGAEAPRRRGPGRLPLAGCVDPRQAHRGHRAADAAPGDGHRGRRRRPAARRARRAWSLRGREPSRGGRGRQARLGSSRAHGYHQGLARDRVVAVGGVLPGDDPRAHARRRWTAKSDPLLGLKENVILGKLIPAGTGLPRYRNVTVEPTEEAKAAMYSMPNYDAVRLPGLRPGLGRGGPARRRDAGLRPRLTGRRTASPSGRPRGAGRAQSPSRSRVPTAASERPPGDAGLGRGGGAGDLAAHPPAGILENCAWGLPGARARQQPSGPSARRAAAGLTPSAGQPPTARVRAVGGSAGGRSLDRHARPRGSSRSHQGVRGPAGDCL